METETKKKHNKLIIGLVIALLLVAIVVVIVVFVISKKDKSKPNTTVSNIVLEEGQEVEQVDPGYFTVQMQLLATSTDGENFTGTIANAPENIYQVYVTIALKDTEEEIYRSDLFPVGSQIEAFTVNRKLEKGKHECVLTFHNMEEDGETEVSMVNVAYTLDVN